MKKHIKQFRIETNKGRIVGHAHAIEAAEWIASKGRGRWIFRWFEGRYCCAKQY
jgi:hypothetical protein